MQHKQKVPFPYPLRGYAKDIYTIRPLYHHEGGIPICEFERRAANFSAAGSVFALGNHGNGRRGVAAAARGAARRLRRRRGERQIARDERGGAMRQLVGRQRVGALARTAVAARRTHLRRRRMQRQILRIAGGCGRCRCTAAGRGRSRCGAGAKDAIQIAEAHVLGEQRMEVGQLVVGRHQLLRQQARIEVLMQRKVRRPKLGGQRRRMPGQCVRRQRYAQRKLGQTCVEKAERRRA